MGKEIKIALRPYKIAYALFVVAVLSVIRGVSRAYEIGSEMEPMMAVLAAVFCADTYTQEIAAGRSEVQRLCPMKKRLLSIAERMLVQECFLFALAAAGYGLFLLIQRPAGRGEFLWYLAAMAVTLVFWGIFSHTISCVCRSAWAGIGGSLLVWAFTTSAWGNRLFGAWNLFSYTFRSVKEGGDFSWLRGKFFCICFSIAMAAALPKILEERG